jgi:hypothetical protein
MTVMNVAFRVIYQIPPDAGLPNRCTSTMLPSGGA